MESLGVSSASSRGPEGCGGPSGGASALSSGPVGRGSVALEGSSRDMQVDDDGGPEGCDGSESEDEDQQERRRMRLPAAAADAAVSPAPAADSAVVHIRCTYEGCKEKRMTYCVNLACGTHCAMIRSRTSGTCEIHERVQTAVQTDPRAHRRRFRG